MAAVVTLPRYVAFQGDNRKLLITSPTGRTPMLEFSADLDFLQRMAMVHEVFVVDAATGTIAIKYLTNGKFWQLSYDNPYRQDAVMADFDRVPTASDRSALFVAVQLDKETVALRNVAANLYCDRRAYNFLLPRAEQITTSGRMVVKQPILSTNLNNIVYHTDKARINNRHLIALGSHEGRNNSSFPGEVKIEISYENRSTTSWSNSITTSLSMTMKFNAGAPLVTEGGIEITASVSHEYAWGQETSKSVTVTASYTVPNVPPGAAVRVSTYAEEAQCDVPFSYTQVDTLPDGLPRSNDFIDGVFLGTNIFNVYTEAVNALNNEVLHRAPLVI